MVFGSRTCPVTESAAPVLKRLHARFGDSVRFVLVNTREAHPGQTIGQPATAAEKHRHAHHLRHHHAIPFEVAVDDIDGTVHRAFTPKPNSAYLADPGGTILFRAHWANDEAALRRALERTTSGAPCTTAAGPWWGRCCGPSDTSRHRHRRREQDRPRRLACRAAARGPRRAVPALRPPAGRPAGPAAVGAALLVCSAAAGLLAALT